MIQGLRQGVKDSPSPRRVRLRPSGHGHPYPDGYHRRASSQAAVILPRPHGENEDGSPPEPHPAPGLFASRRFPTSTASIPTSRRSPAHSPICPWSTPRTGETEKPAAVHCRGVKGKKYTEVKAELTCGDIGAMPDGRSRPATPSATRDEHRRWAGIPSEPAYRVASRSRPAVRRKAGTRASTV